MAERFAKGQKVRVHTPYLGIPRGLVVTYLKPSCHTPEHSWVTVGADEALVRTGALTPAEPVTTPEEAARYERVERVLDAANDSMVQVGWSPLWYTTRSNTTERAALAALLLDLMERGEL